MQSAAAIGLTGFGGAGTARVEPPGVVASGGPSLATSARPRRRPQPEATGIDAVLRGGSFWPIVGAFFIAGLLLSLTPCVLPMLPIVSSIIVGQAGSGSGPALAGAGAASAARRPVRRAAAASRSPRRTRSAWRSSTPPSASPPAWPAKGLAAALQNPWVLGAFALGLVALSLSMFGVYELQLPSSLSRPDQRRGAASCRAARSPACSRWAASRR